MLVELPAALKNMLSGFHENKYKQIVLQGKNIGCAYSFLLFLEFENIVSLFRPKEYILF